VVPVIDLGHDSEALAVNDDGIIVGRANGRAARWDAAGRFTDLGTLPDSHYSHAVDVNSHGTVVGQSATLAGRYHLVLWDRHGSITDRGTLPGGTYFNPVAINDDDSVLGYGDSANGTYLVRWDHDGPTLLEPSPYDESIESVSLNDHGIVVGSGASSGSVFRWDRAGHLTQLPRFEPSFSHYATDIENDGTVTGYARHRLDDRIVPLLWESSGGLTVLDTLVGIGGAASATNRHGVTVGWFHSTGGSRYAGRWDAGQAMTHLGTLPGYSNSWASHIADNGTIAGEAHRSVQGGTVTRAIRWETTGRLSELGTLGGANSWVTAINASGLTIGRAEDGNGRVRPVLWPVVRP
jgi:uncharacterized membrane protein